MKPSTLSLSRFLVVLALPAALSSCRLFRDGGASARWEIESEVPSSLSTGRASAPMTAANTGVPLRSDLSGVAPASATAGQGLDLPGLESGFFLDIPKPEVVLGGPVAQSPPEMLNIPGSMGDSDLPYSPVSAPGMNTLLPGPPPAVTEEELSMAPEAMPALSPGDSLPATIAAQDQPAITKAVPLLAFSSPEFPSIPLLYGNLDLNALFTPPALSPVAPAPQLTQNP